MTRKEPYFINANGALYQGYCEESMPALQEGSVDLCVTDPPYGYSFMGKKWDIDVPSVKIWQELLRVLKPGAFAFIMSAPRQDVFSKMINNIAAAGFQISYTPIFWAYNSGFPKARDVSKEIDKKLGYERKPIEIPGKQKSALCWGKHYTDGRQEVEFTEPVSEEAKRFSGAYVSFVPRPAVEVIIVAMKPIVKDTYLAQTLDNGKGVTWMGDCHISTEEGTRFMSNLIASDEILGEEGISYDLDAWDRMNVDKLPIDLQATFPFLFVPKPVKSEKEVGCELMEEGKWKENSKADSPIDRAGKARKNIHPTVKPLKLFSYLITLGSRKGDTIIDPFLGSGTAAIAAELMERKWIGCELMEDYAKTSVARISAPRKQVKALGIIDDIQELKNSESQMRLSAFV